MSTLLHWHVTLAGPTKLANIVHGRPDQPWDDPPRNVGD